MDRMSRLKHILSGSPALRLHSRLILCAAAAWCFAVLVAHAQSLGGAVTLQIVAGEPKPSELNLSGHHNADVIPDADDRVALPVRFDRSEPRSFQVVLLATWGDSGFNELPLSFDPLDLGKRFVINLVNWQPEFPAEYSVSGLTAMSRGNCQRLRNSVSSLFGTYHVCRQIYERFHAKGHGDFLGALIAFKGWFDAAYRLSTVHRAATSLGRDLLLEDLARKLEDRARDDGNLQVRLASTGVQLGYYTGMPGNWITRISSDTPKSARSSTGRRDRPKPSNAPRSASILWSSGSGRSPLSAAPGRSSTGSLWTTSKNYPRQ